MYDRAPTLVNVSESCVWVAYGMTLEAYEAVCDTTKRVAKQSWKPGVVVVGPRGQRWWCTTQTAARLGLFVVGCESTGSLTSMLHAAATLIRFRIERVEVGAGKDCPRGLLSWMAMKRRK
jgi:hypothetical protein